MKTDFSIPLRYGLIGGFIICIISILSYLFYTQLFGSLMAQSIFGLSFFALIVFIPVWGTVTFKRSVGSVTFQQAFLAAMIIISISMAFSSVMSYVIPNIIDTDYPVQLHQLVQKNTAETMEKFGTSDEEIEKAMDRIKLEDFKPTLLKTLRSFGISLAMGAGLSLIIALFVSRPNKEQPKAEA